MARKTDDRNALAVQLFRKGLGRLDFLKAELRILVKAPPPGLDVVPQAQRRLGKIHRQAPFARMV